MNGTVAYRSLSVRKYTTQPITETQDLLVHVKNKCMPSILHLIEMMKTVFATKEFAGLLDPRQRSH